MKEQIRKWLRDPNRKHSEGVGLYEKYGRNNILINLFNRKETETIRKKVLYELMKMAEVKEEVKQPPARNIPAISKEKQALINESLRKITGNNQPAIIIPAPNKDADLERQRAKLFNDRARLSNQLREVQTDQERKVIIDKIKVIEKEYYGVIDSIKHVQRTGALPEEQGKPVKNSKYEIPATLEQKMQALLNARSRRSKAIKKAKILGDTPAGLKKQKEVANEDNFIESLEAALK